MSKRKITASIYPEDPITGFPNTIPKINLLRNLYGNLVIEFIDVAGNNWCLELDYLKTVGMVIDHPGLAVLGTPMGLVVTQHNYDEVVDALFPGNEYAGE